MAKRKAPGARRSRTDTGAKRSSTAKKTPARQARGKASSRAAQASRPSRSTAASKKRTVGGRTAPGKKTAKVAAKKAAARTPVARKAVVRKAAPQKPVAKKSVARKTAALKTAAKQTAARKTAAAARKRTAPKRAPVKVAKSPAVVARKVPALGRSRRTMMDDDIVPSPPSSLDLDRTASSSRSGRIGLRDKFAEHTETGPELTGGDVDADWESAYSVGDEAPGGDNPTPDQDLVDDIGRAVGVEYQDNEELKGEAKISDRDRHRWELDPASSDDYEDR